MTPVAWGVKRGSDNAIVSAFVNERNAKEAAAEIGGVDFDDGYWAVPLYPAPADRAMTEALAKCVEALIEMRAIVLMDHPGTNHAEPRSSGGEAWHRSTLALAAALPFTAAARAKGE